MGMEGINSRSKVFPNERDDRQKAGARLDVERPLRRIGGGGVDAGNDRNQHEPGDDAGD